ncbi:MAG: 4-alpha-glucanotransferase, partial [Planctomycetota bacterium]
RERAAFVARTAADPRRFCEAMFAELFLGPANNVYVFFADLLGETRLYNQPGTVADHNWTLRVAPDYRETYWQRANLGEALNLPRSLALALEARAGDLGEAAMRLAGRLREASRGV